jgi:hypothetical protein
VEGVSQRVYDPHRVGGRHDHWLIVRLHSLETPTTCRIGYANLSFPTSLSFATT